MYFISLSTKMIYESEKYGRKIIMQSYIFFKTVIHIKIHLRILF